MKGLRIALLIGLAVICIGPWVLALALIIGLAKALSRAD